MGYVTGVKSRVDGVATFRDASVSATADLKRIVHAGTLGGPQRLIGVKDWNGTWNEYGLVPTWLPGEEIVYIQSIDGTKGLKGSAIVTQTVITIPVGSKDPPTVQGTFRGIAAIDKNDTTAVAIATATAIPDIEGLCVFLADLAESPSFSAQAGTNEIVITLSIEDRPIHDCGTSGYMDALEGTWDANVTYKRFVDNLNQLPIEGTPYHVKVPIDAAASEFYLFEYMRVGEITDITFNRESADLINVTIPLEMSIIELIGGTATAGTGVTMPDTNVWRPTET